MRYRLRTLMILLAVLPPVLGLVYHPLMHAYNEWVRECTAKAELAELETRLDQIAERQSVRTKLIRDVLNEQPPTAEGPGLTAVPVSD